MKKILFVWILIVVIIPSIYGCKKFEIESVLIDEKINCVSPIIYVKDFGAKGDGTTDDTSFIQSALDEASKRGGGIVQLGSGVYAVRGNLSVPRSVTLKGMWETPPNTGSINWREMSFSEMKLPSMLLAYADQGDENATPFITMNLGSAIVGLAIYYPEQRQTASPFPYPYTIQSSVHADGVALKNIMLVNAYKGVDFGTNQTQRPYIDGLYGQTLKTGLYIDQNYDVGRVSNVHFWPFWGYGFSEVSKYTQEHGEGIIVGRADWQYFDNCFIIGMKTGFRFIDSAVPGIGAGNILITGGGADICQNAVLIEQTQSHSGVSFVNAQIYGDVIVSSDNDGPVKFTNCGFFGSINGVQGVRYMDLSGKGRISFDNCHFNLITKSANTAPVSFLLDAINISFQNSEFRDEDITLFRLTKNVQALTLIGNTFKGEFEIKDNSNGNAHVVEIGNVTGVGTGARMLLFDKYKYGTEKTTLVDGGDFHNMDKEIWQKDWNIIGNIEQLEVSLSTLLNSNVLNVNPYVVPQLGATGIQKQVKLRPDSEYVISAWIGSELYPSGTLDLNIDLDDKANQLRLTLTTIKNSSQVGFYYATFDTKDTGTDVNLRVFYDGKSGSFTENRAIGWWKNIAITQKEKFSLPEKR